MRKHKIKVITYAWQIRCKVQSCCGSQLSIYHPIYIYSPLIRNGLFKRLTWLSSCLLSQTPSTYSLSGLSQPYPHSGLLSTPLASDLSAAIFAPANCSLRRYANCMEINYFRNWNWRFSDSSPKMFWSMSNFIVNARVVVEVVMSVRQRRLKDRPAL